ncbi:ABC transporter permease [candidate division KSB1 bacterium]
MNKKVKKRMIFARWLLSKCSDYSDMFEISADFDAEYLEILTLKGRFRAWLWYWLQTINAVANYYTMKISGSGRMFINYFKIALRNVKRYKAYSTINIMGLAIGLACCILILLWVQDELKFDKFNENIDRLYRVVTVKTTNGQLQFADRKTSYPVADAFVDEFPEIVNAARFLITSQKTLKYENRLFNENALVMVDPALLELFTFRFLAGSGENALNEKNSIILTESMAIKYFGSEDPIGKVITVDNKYGLTVTGVIGDIPHNSHFKGYDNIEFLVSFSFNSNYSDDTGGWDSFYLKTYVLLEDNADPDGINDKLTGYLNKKQESMSEYDFYLQSVRDMNFYTITGELTGMKNVYIFILLGGLILLAACINYMNLSTAFSFNRAKEIGLRKVVGAKKAGLIKQFLSESVIYSLIAMIISMFLVKIFLPYYNALTGKLLTFDMFDIIMNMPVIVILAAAAGIVSGSYPAFFLSSFQPVKVLNKLQFTGLGKFRFRKILVISQFTVSTALLIGTFIIYEQSEYFLNEDIGYNDSNVICFNKKDTGDISRYDSFRSEIISNPGIAKVSAASIVPGFSTSYASSNISWEGKDPENKTVFQGFFVDYGFIETLEMRMISGEPFSRKKNQEDADYIIINKRAAEETGFDDPIGRSITFLGNTWTIVGIAENYPVFSLKYGDYPLVMILNRARSRMVYIKTTASETGYADTINNIEESWAKFYPEYPFEYFYLDDRNNNIYESERKMGRVFGYFSFLSIFICCLGIYGLMSFMVQQKSKELSIRKVMGAKKSALMMILSKESLKCAMIANIAAWPLSWFLLDKWLQNYANRIELQWGVFITAGIIIIILSFLPVVSRIFSAVRSNPVKSLRYE